ncbi:MAG: hypothetical protein KGM99_05750 [Burkholderiales bacterium]|nr:hypothetical protein [Burkholderiales bacterium]
MTHSDPRNLKVHGEWEITLVRNVLVRSTAGSLNVAGMYACFQEVKAKAPATAWASLSNGSNWEMSSAEALQTLKAMRQWVFSHHCACVAVVIPGLLRRNIHQRETGAAGEQNVRYFSSLEQACAWLSDRGFRITPEDYPHYAFLERTKF